VQGQTVRLSKSGQDYLSYRGQDHHPVMPIMIDEVEWSSSFPARGAVVASVVDGFRLGLKIFGPLAELFSNVVPDRDAL
jgi:hypothetical protein